MTEFIKNWLVGVALAGNPPTAGINWTPLDPIPKTANPTQQIGSVVGDIIQWLLWIAGALVVAYLIYGGIIYITSAGNPEKATAGKGAIINAIIGVVIILLSYVIVSWVKGIID